MLVFDITGEFGFFRVPESTRSTLSFPFTRTAILGIIGSILGLERNSYWKSESALGDAAIALEIMKTVEHTPLTMNYLQTATTMSVAGRGGLSTFLPTGTYRGFVTAVSLDLLRDIHFRIYFRSEDQKLYSKLKEYLENNWAEFPPYLGHANLLADIDFIGEFTMNKSSVTAASINSVVPASYVDTENKELPFFKTATIITGIPIRYKVDKGKIVKTVNENFLVPPGGKKIINVQIKDDIDVFEISTDQAAKKPKLIVFMPDGKNQESMDYPKIIK